MKVFFRLFSKVKRLIVLAAVTGLFIGGVYLILFSDLFSIKDIDCRVNGVKSLIMREDCGEELRAETEQYLGKSTLRLKTDEIVEKLISSDRSIESVVVKVNLPDKLKIVVIYRVAFAQITTATETGKVIVIDQEGVILEQSKINESLPAVIWPSAESWKIEQPVPEYVRKATQIAFLVGERFKLLKPPIIESNLTMRGQISTGQIIVFSLEKEPLSQIQALQVVVSQVRIDGIPREIDLRFDNPVLKP